MKIYTHIKSILFQILLLSVVFTSCSNSSKDNTTTTPPTNLQTTVTIVGADATHPNGDGSGKITLTATAQNATLYKANFNGTIVESQTGIFDFTCTEVGTKTYNIPVLAYKSDKYISTTVQTIVFVKQPQLVLVWQDEFNVDGTLDSKNWGYDTGNNNGWGNAEAEYYTSRPENVIVEGGLLKIKTIKENYQGSNYTSARVLTKGKYSFKYGRIEFRAKLPVGKGTWPALWLLGDNIGTANWPACGEMDVMEQVGNDANRIYSTLHYPGNFGANGKGTSKYYTNVSSEFHIYSMEWTATTINFYVDNGLLYTFQNDASLPFNQNFFIIINNAIGGNFGGAIDPNFTASEYQIDYVRVYQ